MKHLSSTNYDQIQGANFVHENAASAPASPTLGQIYYDTAGDTLKVYTTAGWATITSVTASGPYIHRRSRNSNVSIPDSSITQIGFGTQDQESGSAVTWDGTNNRFTVNIAGVYVITANIMWAGNSTGSRRLNINAGALTDHVRSVPGNTNNYSQTLTVMVNLAVSDIINCQVYQNSGGALNIDGTTAAGTPSFQVALIKS